MMNKSLSKNQELIIISQEVTNAAKCVVTDVFDDESFEVKLSEKENYSADEKVELFAVVGSGVLYLGSDVQKVDNLTLKISKPDKNILIQRREYARIELHKNILINHENKTIRAEIADISAGGMRLFSETEMSDKTDYQVNINLAENVNFSCKYKPVRVVFDEKTNKYTVSGKFKLIRNIDRVSLIQYCMKKQSEIQNK